MAATEVPNGIILFHYPFSPYARRIVWYLTLRGIPYAQCIQPFILPRPDLEELGIKYRRIPLLSIGRDVHCDTRLILDKLDKRFPPSSYPPLSTRATAGISALLDKFTTDAGVFARAAQLLPSDLPTMKDPKFVKDREEMTGRTWQKADVDRARPEAMAHMRKVFDVLESLLQDGRQWIAGTERVSRADVEAVWPVDWLFELKTLSPNLFSDKIYPRTFAWVLRFRGALKSARGLSPKAVTLKGAEAVKHVLSAEYTDETGVDSEDPLGLQEGAEVQVWPIDSGSGHRDRGRLVTLAKDEVAVIVPTKDRKQEVRVHTPRWGFRVARSGAGAKL